MREFLFYLEDIAESIEKIGRYITKMDFSKFEKNDLVIDAVVRNLEVIGEAAKNVPENIKLKFPEVPWNKMIGVRNITIHEYFEIDLSIIWQIITVNLPEVKNQILEILKKNKK